MDNILMFLAGYLVVCGVGLNLYWFLRWTFRAQPAEVNLTQYQARVRESARTLYQVGYRNADGLTLDVEEVQRILWQAVKAGDK